MRLPLASVIWRVTRLPNTLAVRVMVSRETETLCGSRRRLSCERLVWSSFAMACFVLRCSRIACSSCQASTRLMATVSASSRMLCVVKKGRHKKMAGFRQHYFSGFHDQSHSRKRRFLQIGF